MTQNQSAEVCEGSYEQENNIIDIDVNNLQAKDYVGRSRWKFDYDAALSLVQSESSVDTKVWAALGVQPGLAKYLVRQDFTKPTPIQDLVVKSAIEKNQSQVIISQTGSGKTLAFLIPIIQLALTSIINKEDRQLRYVVLAPTHELAQQIFKHMEATFPGLNKSFQLAVPLVGGMAIQKQQRLLENKPLIVIATPGRLQELLKDHIYFQNLEKVEKIVIDEADKMLQQGNFQELVQFVRYVNECAPATRITLCSATMHLPTGIMEKELRFNEQTPLNTKRTVEFLHTSWTDEEKRLLTVVHALGFKNQKIQLANIAPVAVVSPNVQEYWHMVDSDRDKMEVLWQIVMTRHRSTLVFVNSVAQCKFLAQLFRMVGVPSLMLNAQMEQRARMRSLEFLRDNPAAVLFATDVAARGIDLPNIEYVIQFGAPASAAIHIHRVGRAARLVDSENKIQGVAVSLVGFQDQRRFEEIKAVCGFDKRTMPKAFPINYKFSEHSSEMFRTLYQLIEIGSDYQIYCRKFNRIYADGLAAEAESEDDAVDEAYVKADIMPIEVLQKVAAIARERQSRKDYGLNPFFIKLNVQPDALANVHAEDIYGMLKSMKREIQQLTVNLTQLAKRALFKLKSDELLKLRAEKQNLTGLELLLSEHQRQVELTYIYGKPGQQAVDKKTQKIIEETKKNQDLRKTAPTMSRDELFAKLKQVKHKVQAPAYQTIVQPKIVDINSELAAQAKVDFDTEERNKDIKSARGMDEYYKKQDRVKKHDLFAMDKEINYDQVIKDLAANEFEGQDPTIYGPKDQRVRKDKSKKKPVGRK